eukprot:CAMPEP_0179024096 /NCGR_PEP_ID=MMETSP0796-20121207/7277_1 /TAXON_ID=73915 /ORGANISM="Pyrodinium bahamense, Strain pbaha01" /LENGTH=497 /DNA_ID=CAMNT_0020720043 /DNA_START=48 /DNA_END=1541 /DNA_ORIENTATION=+
MKLFITLASVSGVGARNSLSHTPPMGWMSWEIFRCETDCSKDPASCISEWLYKNQTDALVLGGYVEAGYTGIHVDDCWMQKGSGSAFQADGARFPSGLSALGDHLHKRGVKFGLYTAESPTTCAGYPASAGHEAEHAKLFAAWGVDYMKVDGCGTPEYYERGYQAMGAALEASGRAIEYSCSWPAYIGDDETTKPFPKFIMDGCNGWRNWADIQCSWGSVSSIIDHWGDYGFAMAPFAGPGHWHDMDMLLVGSNCLTLEEEQTQMALWAISASPLIMGNDLQKVPPHSRDLLLNKDAIAVSQDSLGQMGLRLRGFTSKSPWQVWARNLANGDVAVALYNKLGTSTEEGGPTCPSWHEIREGLLETCAGGAGDFLLRRFSAEVAANLSLAEVQAACCADPSCEGFNFRERGQPVRYEERLKGCDAAPPSRSGGPVDIKVVFADLNLFGAVVVYDIWARRSVGTFTGSYTASAVPLHGTAFIRLSGAVPGTNVGAVALV